MNFLFNIRTHYFIYVTKKYKNEKVIFEISGFYLITKGKEKKYY